MDKICGNIYFSMFSLSLSAHKKGISVSYPQPLLVLSCWNLLLNGLLKIARFFFSKSSSSLLGQLVVILPAFIAIKFSPALAILPQTCCKPSTVAGGHLVGNFFGQSFDHATPALTPFVGPTDLMPLVFEF